MKARSTFLFEKTRSTSLFSILSKNKDQRNIFKSDKGQARTLKYKVEYNESFWSIFQAIPFANWTLKYFVLVKLVLNQLINDIL